MLGLIQNQLKKEGFTFLVEPYTLQGNGHKADYFKDAELCIMYN